MNNIAYESFKEINLLFYNFYIMDLLENKPYNIYYLDSSNYIQLKYRNFTINFYNDTIDLCINSLGEQAANKIKEFRNFYHFPCLVIRNKHGIFDYIDYNIICHYVLYTNTDKLKLLITETYKFL